MKKKLHNRLFSNLVLAACSCVASVLLAEHSNPAKSAPPAPGNNRKPAETALPPPAPVVLEKVNEVVAAYPAGTCEREYYDQFLTQGSKGAPSGESDEDFTEKATKPLKVVRALQQSVEEMPTIQKISEHYPQIAGEWLKRIHAAETQPSDRGEGATVNFLSPSGAALFGNEKDLFGEPIRSISTTNPTIYERPVITWSFGKHSPTTWDGQAFILLHEMTHLINWAPPGLVRCLANPEAAAARSAYDETGLSAPEKVFGLFFGKLPSEKEFTPDFIRESLLKLEYKAKDSELDAIASDLRLSQTLLKRCQFGSRRSSLLNLISAPPQIEQIRPKLELKSYLKPKKTPPARGGTMAAPKMEKNSDPREGWGTENFVTMEDCINKDLPAAKRLLDILKRYKVSGLPGKEAFADQMIETTADYFATDLVTDSILSRYKTPADQKAAARDVLKALPPTLYPPDARDVLDYVGSKKTNESRVFRTLLANPRFRNLLGCRFHNQPTPRYCKTEM